MESGSRRSGGRRGGRTPRLSVVVVTWESAAEVEPAMEALEAELRGRDELIVVDNASSDGTADVVAEATSKARIIRNHRNIGFVGGANRGAELAGGDLLVLLNPDAQVEPGWRDAISRPWLEGYGWEAWQALITTAGGRLINSDGNEIHFTGICWAGRAGRPVGEAPREPREVGYASGACLVVPLARWREIGGFPERLFMYGDDVDVCLRLRLLGHRIGIEPGARVEHDYEFDKGGEKWRLLERARWALLIRDYPGAVLAAVAPALLVAELAIFAAAARGGWLGQKLRATADLLSWLPELRAERREIQRLRKITAGEFAAHLTGELDSAYLGPLARRRGVRSASRAYWTVARTIISRSGA